MKVVGTKLDDEDYVLFESCCSEKGMSKSEQLRSLIKQYVEQLNQQETKNDLEVKPIPKIRIKRISRDDGKTWTDIPQLTDAAISD